MNKKQSAPALFLGTLFLLSMLWTGCAGPKETTVDRDIPAYFPNHSVDQIRDALMVSAANIDAFESKSSMRVKTSTDDQSFDATLTMVGGDSLHMSVSVLLGLNVAQALFTADSFFVHDKFFRKFYYGPLGYTGSVLPIPIYMDDMIENVLGILIPDAETPWTITPDSSQYHLAHTRGLLQYTYTIDPSIWRVVRYEIRTTEDVLVEERVFSSFDNFSGYYLPRRIVGQRPLEAYYISVYHQRLTLNPPDVKIDFRVGNNVERIPLENDE